METISLLSIVIIAFLGSFGHCVGMCGGIVVAYSTTKIKDNYTKQRESLSHLLYSFGRISTYVVLGAIFGSLGSVVTFSHTINGILLLITGSLMLLAGLSLLGKIKFLTLIEHSITKSSWYQKNFRELISSNSLLSFYTLGLLNGLLPCGFVYFFAITAASTGSTFYGALVMLIFGLSTIPALFSLGFFVTILKQSNFRNIMIKLASISVIIFALFTLYKGYGYIVDIEKWKVESHA